MATINKETQAEIAKLIDEATADQHKIPGVVFASVNAKGETLFEHASGKRGVDSEQPMTMDSVFWIASCTKMIGALCCMQLVEAGRLKLDDGESLAQLVPELRHVKILKGVGKDGKPELVENTKPITLRMLLTHTAGFGYSFFNPLLKASNGAQGWDEFSGDGAELLSMPLVFEPGADWQYGVNIDWAGLAVERVSGKSLNAYMQEYIFKPLGITEINMFPNEDMKSRLSFMHQRSGPHLRVRDHLHRRALTVPERDHANVFNSAGAGCFAKPTEYCKILAALLNGGKSPTTGNRILKRETVDELFKNQIPDKPNFGRNAIPDTKPDLTNPIPELYPQPHEQPQGWSLIGMMTIHPGPTGRGNNTQWWAGLANLFWWLDVEKGVAGMIASQILPFADANVMGLWFGVEGKIYEAIAKGS